MPGEGAAATLWTLATWFSPGFPVGAYTYSHGLESAVAEGVVHDGASAGTWIAGCVAHGAGRNDTVLLAHAWRAVGDAADLTELAAALAPSRERLVETEAMGAAFSDVTEAGAPAPYPVAIGAAAAARGVPLDDLALMFLHAFAANLVSAAVRLVPLGQTEGQRVLARLAPVCEAVAAEAVAARLDDLGGCAILADIASMRHETQPVRIFRT